MLIFILIIILIILIYFVIETASVSNKTLQNQKKIEEKIDKLLEGEK